MEEDIKIIKASKIMSDDIEHSEHSKRLRKSIENLIKGYRELEEERRMFYRGNVYTANQLKNSIPKSKIKEIVDACIPKGKNIMTGKEEYQPNTNANSFLTQSILELMEDK